MTIESDPELNARPKKVERQVVIEQKPVDQTVSVFVNGDQIRGEVEKKLQELRRWTTNR